MNLRLRLIVAFFVLSVVPLGAVTFYTYRSNASAVRDAAGREAHLLAGELTDRMTLVTTQLSQRFVQLMAIPAQEKLKPAPVAPAPVVAKAAPKPTTKPTAAAAIIATAAQAEKDAVTAKAEEAAEVAQQLGEVAILLNNIDIRGFGRGRGGFPGRTGWTRRPVDPADQEDAALATLGLPDLRPRPLRLRAAVRVRAASRPRPLRLRQHRRRPRRRPRPRKRSRWGLHPHRKFRQRPRRPRCAPTQPVAVVQVPMAAAAGSAGLRLRRFPPIPTACR